MVTKKKKRGSDIPLDNIPERTRTKTAYTDEFKTRAVERMRAGETAESVARDMDIPSSSVIHKWRALVDAGLPFRGAGGNNNPSGKGAPGKQNEIAAIRTALARAIKERDELLEVAAMIVEAEGGNDGPALAKKIRASKRVQ